MTKCSYLRALAVALRSVAIMCERLRAVAAISDRLRLTCEPFSSTSEHLRSVVHSNNQKWVRNATVCDHFRLGTDLWALHSTFFLLFYSPILRFCTLTYISAYTLDYSREKKRDCSPLLRASSTHFCSKPCRIRLCYIPMQGKSPVIYLNLKQGLMDLQSGNPLPKIRRKEVMRQPTYSFSLTQESFISHSQPYLSLQKWFPY